jgi:hypothetical protein
MNPLGQGILHARVTIFGLWSHSGTGEEWTDDDNSVTAADAQAFKRACSCFGLGRYFYDISAIWVDLDENRQPVRTPVLAGWALPENWRKGTRPHGKNGNGNVNAEIQGKSSKKGSNGSHGKAVSRPTSDNGGNSHKRIENSNGSAATNSDEDLDQRILRMEKAIGTAFYHNILREYGRVN